MKISICKINCYFHCLINDQKTFLGIVAQMNKIFNEIVICQMQSLPKFSVVVTLPMGSWYHHNQNQLFIGLNVHSFRKSSQNMNIWNEYFPNLSSKASEMCKKYKFPRDWTSEIQINTTFFAFTSKNGFRALFTITWFFFNLFMSFLFSNICCSEFVVSNPWFCIDTNSSGNEK